MPSEAVNAVTRSEWRELGFFYEFQLETNAWRLVGSKGGLLGFAKLIRRYIESPRNHALSEHEHFGPYMYLKVCTWKEAEINSHSIAGTISDLKRLADLIEQALWGATPGESREIATKYEPSSPCRLILEVREDSFDPATADPGCW